MELSGLQFTVIVVAFCALLAISWGMTIRYLKDQNELLRYVFTGGWVLAIVSVILVTFTIGMLTAIDKMDTSAAASLLGAIAGYALGSFRRTETSDGSK